MCGTHYQLACYSVAVCNMALRLILAHQDINKTLSFFPPTYIKLSYKKAVLSQRWPCDVP